METSSATPIRVVLIDMSRLTREVIRGILEEEPEIDVVREVNEDTLPLRQLLEETDPDVMIVGNDAQSLLANCRALLGAHVPRLVVAVSAEAREARLYGVRPYETVGEEFSSEFVVNAIRNC